MPDANSSLGDSGTRGKSFNSFMFSCRQLRPVPLRTRQSLDLLSCWSVPQGKNAKETGEPMQGIFMRLLTLHTLCTEANQAEDNLLRPSTWNVLDGAAFKGVLAP